MGFFSKLLPDGLSSRLCTSEPDCRVKPIQIDGNSDSNLSVTIFQENGAILGAAISDLDTLNLVANVGETWDDDESDYVQKFDAITGEKLTSSGWTLTRRLDGTEWDFKSLTGILEALKTGTFGVKFVSSLDTLGSPTDDAPFAEDEDYDTAPCATEQCFDCFTPVTCEAQRLAEPGFMLREPLAPGFPLREPLGWDAPELR